MLIVFARYFIDNEDAVVGVLEFLSSSIDMYFVNNYNGKTRAQVFYIAYNLQVFFVKSLIAEK